MPRLAGAGSRCHNKSNTLRQQQQQLADILVQVPPNICVACCRVAGGGGCGALIRFPIGAVFSIFSPQRSFVLYYLTCDRCLRFRGCPAELGIELSVSARMICYERKQHGQGHPSAQYSYFLLQQYMSLVVPCAHGKLNAKHCRTTPKPEAHMTRQVVGKEDALWRENRK